jgi:hypothetical protein
MVHERRNKRGPIEHVAKVPLTAEERVELETIATLERSSYAEILRRALHEYQKAHRGRRA